MNKLEELLAKIKELLQSLLTLEKKEQEEGSAEAFALVDLEAEYTPSEMQPLPSEHRARMLNADDCVHTSFRAEAVQTGLRCIKAVRVQGDGKPEVYAYLFDRNTFDFDAAQKWASQKGLNVAAWDQAKDQSYPKMTACPAVMTFDGAIEIKAGKTPSVDILAYTGGLLHVAGFDHPIVVDLAGLETDPEQTAIVKDHDLSKVVGHGQSIKAGGSLRISGVMSGSGPAAKEVLASAEKGFKWRASIGCRIIQARMVPAGKSLIANGQTIQGPLIYAEKARLKEVSIVASGADDGSAVSIAASSARGITMTFQEWMKDKGFGSGRLLNAKAKASLQATYEAEMKASGQTAVLPAEEDDEPDPIAVQRQQMADEAQRTAGVQKHFRALKAQFSGASFAEKAKWDEENDAAEIKAIANGWTAEQAELHCLKRAGSVPKAPAGHAVSREVTGQVVEAAAAVSWGLKDAEKSYNDQTLQAAHTQFRHSYLGPQRLLLMAAQANGYSGYAGGIDDGNLADVMHHAFAGQPGSRVQPEVRAEFSTLSLPGILSNLMNKLLLEGFWAVDSSWRDVARTRPVKDFKPHPSFRFYGNLTYEAVGKGGELHHGTVGEVGYFNQADTYGKMFVTTRKDIINDDLGALQELPRMMGMGAAYAFNEVFWKEWLRGITAGQKTPSSTTGAGTASGTVFWSTTNGNTATGAASALSISALTTAKQKFLEQKKPDGKPLAVPPAVLLVPPALNDLAQQLMSSQYLYEAVLGLAATNAGTTEKIPTDNPHRGLFKKVMSPYLATAYATLNGGGTDTGWWLCADPAVLASIEAAFLNGQQTPTVQSSEAEFQILGIQHRGFWDFGVSLQEPRGSVYSAGT